MRKTICGGLRIPRRAYTPEQTSRLIEIIHEEREKLREVEKKEPDLLCGVRFEDDDQVIARMESVEDQEKLFANGDHEAVIDALYECMSADYWYRFEKDWG